MQKHEIANTIEQLEDIAQHAHQQISLSVAHLANLTQGIRTLKRELNKPEPPPVATDPETPSLKRIEPVHEQ